MRDQVKVVERKPSHSTATLDAATVNQRAASGLEAGQQDQCESERLRSEIFARSARVREKGHPTRILALLTDAYAPESGKDLLLAAKAVGAQFGAHLGNYRHHSVAVAHDGRKHGTPLRHWPNRAW